MSLNPFAELAGAQVFEVSSPSGQIPDAKTRKKLHAEVSIKAHENLMIFVNQERSQSIWYWQKREGKKAFEREHFYSKHQSGDLIMSKIQALHADMSEFDNEGNISLREVIKLKHAFDVEKVTKKFYKEFQDKQLEFIDLIAGIDDERQALVCFGLAQPFDVHLLFTAQRFFG
ncbi:MAG: hypothetical protein R2865_16555 [Deinococcales bacterium]